jgi:FkbM family methyltransferase
MTQYWNSAFLKHLGDLETQRYIVEVGSRYGDEVIKLHDLFENSLFFAFECNPNTAKICEQKLEKYTRIKFFNMGLGCEETELPFYSYILNNDGASSFYKRKDSEVSQEYRGMVKTKKLHTVMLENEIPYINLLCMDIQGFELNVLKGCDSFLNKIEYVIMEEPKAVIDSVYSQNWYDGAPTSLEIKNFMALHGWVEIERLQENKMEDNVMYKNTLFNEVRLFK